MEQLQENKAGIWEILTVFVKWRRLLVVNFLAAAVITFIVASFLPKWYSSNASIFPPEKESTGMNLASSLLGGGLGSMLSGSGMSLPAFATLSDIYATILKSRVVAEGVIDENNLMEVYKLKSPENTLRTVNSHLDVSVGPEGIIGISYEDKDPQRAASIVGSFIENLNKINRRVQVARATATRQFIEERLTQTKIDLADAENKYKDFQLKNKAISLEDQVRALIDNLAELQSQLVMAEIEHGVLIRTFLPSHTKVKQQEAKIEEIKRQIKLLEMGASENEQDSTLSIPFYEAPELGLELVRLTRNLKIQEAVFELLTQQHEQAKIQEKRDTPTVQVLDPPKIPEKKSGPKRAIMSLMAGMLCLILTTGIVFIKEFIDRNKRENTETYRRLKDMAENLKNDFYLIRTVFSKDKRGNDDQVS